MSCSYSDFNNSDRMTDYHVVIFETMELKFHVAQTNL